MDNRMGEQDMIVDEGIFREDVVDTDAVGASDYKVYSLPVTQEFTSYLEEKSVTKMREERHVRTYWFCVRKFVAQI